MSFLLRLNNTINLTVRGKKPCTKYYSFCMSFIFTKLLVGFACQTDITTLSDDKRYPLSIITIVAAAVVKLYTAAPTASVFNFQFLDIHWTTCDRWCLSIVTIIATTFLGFFFLTCFVRNTEFDENITYSSISFAVLYLFLSR